MWRLYKTGIGLTTRFIGSHTVTHNYSVYTLTASQFTIVLAESPYKYNWLSQLSHNSCWVSSGPRTSCRPNWLSLRLLTWDCSLNSELTTQSQSQSYFTADDQSVSKSWYQGPWSSHDLIFISVDIYEYCFIDYGRPLWREVGSVICHSHCASIVSKYIQIHM
jgi:hypothetical protein